MATVTRYVNTASTAGGDGTTNNTSGATRAYVSLSEWEASEQTDLVAAGDIHHCIFEGSDTTAFTISGWTTGVSNYIKITVAEANRHSGTAASGNAKISNTSNGNHVISVDEDYTWFEYLVIQQDSTGGSDEGMRILANTDNVLISRCIIYTERTTNDQDGVYTGNWAATYSIDNCIIYGFPRVGIHLQNYSGSNNQTANIDYCTIYNCGNNGQFDEGGIASRDPGNLNTLNIYNTAVLDSGPSSAEDYNQFTGTSTWTGTNNIDSDLSLTEVGIDTNAQQDLDIVDTTQSSGSFFVVKDLTGGSEDLLLLDNAAGNLAYGNAIDRVGSEPDSRQNLGLDIIDDTRSTTSPAPDIGASEFTSAAAEDTDLLDGKIIISDNDTDLYDGKLIISDDDTDLYDGKIIVTDADTDLYDGLLVVKDNDTDLYDGKIIVKDIDIDLYDGKVIVANTDVDLYDGKILVTDADTDLYDGKIVVKDNDTNLFDGKIIVANTDIDLLDGKITIKNIDTDLLDGKITIKNVDTDLLDGKVVIISTGAADTNLLDGKITIKNVDTDLLDGKIAIVLGVLEKNDALIIDSIGGLCSQAGLSRIATWDTGGRPSNPLRGTIGFNTSTNQIDVYDGSSWKSVS